MRMPTLLTAVTTPLCGFPLNRGRVSGIASDAAGLGSVLPAGPSGIPTGTLTHRSKTLVLVFAPADGTDVSSPTAAQPIKPSTAIRAARILFIGFSFPRVLHGSPATRRRTV